VSVDLQPLREVFYEEAAEHLTDLEGLLGSLDMRVPDRTGVELMFRAAHSAKASSSTLGLADVTEVAHQLECLLERVCKKQLPLTAQFRDVGLQACGVLKALLAAHRGLGTVDTARAERARQRLQALAARPTSGAAAREPRLPSVADAAEATLLPVGWRGQGRRTPSFGKGAVHAPRSATADATTAAPPAPPAYAHRHPAQGRAGAARKKS
jgi:chemotaxis protein histidine kinase CheA